MSMTEDMTAARGADCLPSGRSCSFKPFDILEAGDLEEALVAAASIGDDRLQKQAQGFAIPHTFTHGSSKQRVEWFGRGVKGGRLSDCDTLGEHQERVDNAFN